MNRPVRIVMMVVGLCLLLYAGAWAVLQMAWFQARLNPFLQKNIAGRLNGTASWETLRLSLPLKAVLLHPVIRATDGKPVISMTRMTIQIRLLPLLKRRLDFGYIRIEEPEVVYVHGISPNLLSFFTPSSPNPPGRGKDWVVTIRRFDVQAGQFLYLDSAAHIEAAVHGISARGFLGQAAGIHARVHGLKGRVRARERLIKIDSLSGLLFVADQALKIGDIRISLAEQAVLSGSLAFPFGRQGKWRAAFSVVAEAPFLRSLGAGKGMALKQLTMKGFRDSLGVVSMVFLGMPFSDRRKALPSFRMNATIKEGRIEFIGEWPDNFAFQGRGRLGKGESEAHADFKVMAAQNLSALLLGQEIYGDGSGRAHWRARQETTLLDLEFEAAEMSWNGLRLTGSKVKLRFDSPGTWNVVSASGKVEGDLARPLSFIGLKKWRGFVQSSFFAQGPISRLEGSAPFEIKDLAASFPVADTVTGMLLLHEGVLSVRDLRLFRDSLQVKGSLAYDYPARIGTALISVYSAADPSAIGTLSAQVGIEGASSNPSVEAVIRITAGRTGELQPPRLDIRATLSDHRLAALCTLQVREACGPLTASAAVAFSPMWRLDTAKATPVNIRIRSTKMCLRPLGLAFLSGGSVDGEFNSDLELSYRHNRWTPSGRAAVSSGRLSVPMFKLALENFTARLEPLKADSNRPHSSPIGVFVSTGAVAYRGVTAKGSMVRGTFSNNILIVDSAYIRLDSGGFSFQGTLPMVSLDRWMQTSGLQLRFSADHLPIAGFNPLISGGKFLSGDLDGRLHVSSSENSFIGRGALNLSAAVFAADEISPAIGPLKASMEFAGDSVRLRTFTGKWGKGTFSAQGVAVFSAMTVGPAVIDLAMKGLPLDFVDDSHVLIDSLRGTIAHDGDEWRFSGDVLLGESHVFKEILANQPVTASLDDKKTARTTPSLEINVRIPENLTAEIEMGQFITGAPLSITVRLGGSVLIQGTGAEPEFAGSINLVDGTVTYLDNVFTVSKGHLRMPGGKELNPLLSLTAKCGIRQAQGGSLKDSIEITLQVSGDLNHPTVQLSSAPVAYTEPEIVGLLTFGTIRAGSGLGTSASVILGKSLSTYASRKAQKGLGLDEVMIQGDLFGNAASSNATVSVSKKIGPRVTLTYRRSIKNNSLQEGVLSWKILSFLFLESETDAQGNAGVDLKVQVEK